jgi:DNA mismatch repair protein MutS
VLDEVGRGTSTYDGMALAWAVGEDLHNRVAARTLFATHFHELTALGDELEGGRNASLAVREQGGEVVFLYRLVEQGADRSYGVQVARLAGLPDHVIERARQVMARLEGLPALPGKETEVLDLKTSPVLPVRPGEAEEVYPADGELLWVVARRLFGLDIANLTPVQALVILNELQQQLRGRE